MTTEADIDFSSLPQVDQTAHPPVQRRPSFEGDVSELPDRGCWALQHLLTRRYLGAEADADVYSWVLEYRKELSVRLAELDLSCVSSTAPALPSSNMRATNPQGASSFCAASRSGTYDSILALHLAQMMCASSGQTVLIGRRGDARPIFGRAQRHRPRCRHLRRPRNRLASTAPEDKAWTRDALDVRNRFTIDCAKWDVSTEELICTHSNRATTPAASRRS